MEKVTYYHPYSGKEVTDTIIGIDGECYIVDRCAPQTTRNLRVPFKAALKVDAHNETEHAQSESDDEGFKGYYGTDKDGNRFHTWDFEESIGE